MREEKNNKTMIITTTTTTTFIISFHSPNCLILIVMKYFSNMREVTQYTLLVAILAILIYIAVVSTWINSNNYAK